MRARASLSVITLSVLLACGGAASDGASSGETEGAGASSTSAESSAPAREGDEASSERDGSEADDRCADARFGETATFAFHDELPFVFDYPAGWDHLAHRYPSQLAGSLARLGHNGLRSSTGLIQYVFSREPTSAEEVTRRLFERSMERIATVTIGGRDVTVYAIDDPGVVNAKFLYPDADGPHVASFIFGSASKSCVRERERIRDLVLGSMTDRS